MNKVTQSSKIFLAKAFLISCTVRPPPPHFSQYLQKLAFTLDSCGLIWQFWILNLNFISLYCQCQHHLTPGLWAAVAVLPQPLCPPPLTHKQPSVHSPTPEAAMLLLPGLQVSTYFLVVAGVWNKNHLLLMLRWLSVVQLCFNHHLLTQPNTVTEV